MGTHPIFESDFDCLTDEMSGKQRGPTRPPPPNLSGQTALTGSVFDQREKLHERGNKLSNLVALTEPVDHSKNYSESPEELCSKAQSLLASEKSSVRKFLSQFTDKTPNQGIQKAAEMYSAAATKWKIAQNFELAATTFEKSAKAFRSADDKFGEVMNLSQCSQCWRQVPDLSQAERATNQAVELYLDMGKMVRAAKELNQIADAYKAKFSREKAEADADKAIIIYKTCHDYYRRDGKARTAASRVNIECANLMVLPGHNFLEAGKVFEIEANFAANEKLLKYSAKYHYFRAGLCKLWFSGAHAHESFNRYCEEYPPFFECREAQLLAELISAIVKTDFGEFTKAVTRHEQCTKLDPWHRDVVNLIQKHHFTEDDEINFDLNEFLDFNKVPGLEDSSSYEDLSNEPDLT